MFDNIGKKIKTVAKYLCYAGIAVSVLTGFILMIAGALENPSIILTGLLVMFVGPVLSWLASLAAYGFGEQIENTAVIAELLAKADAEKTRKPEQN